MLPPNKSLMPINYDTEIYRDLGIYGHDLFELFSWILDNFGVQVAVPNEMYSPSEIPFLRLIAFARRKLGVEEKLTSLTVRDLIRAIERGPQSV